MSEPTLEHPAIKIAKLIDDYRSGRIVIPEFQRDYVWKPSRAAKLIDSLYRRYPVSSLLLWLGPTDVRARRANPRPQRRDMHWLIDGQQRVITLSRAMSGEEGIDIVFNPRTDSFSLANAATRRDANWIRLAEIWDEELFRNLRRHFDGSSRDDRIEAQLERVRRILDYEVPVVRMIGHTFDDAVTALSASTSLARN